MTWETAPLGEVARFIRGVTYKPGDVVAYGADGVACLRTKNIQSTLDLTDLVHVRSDLKYRVEQRVQEDDVLVSSANSWHLVGRAVQAGADAEGMLIGGFIGGLRFKPDVVSPRYGYYWFSSPAIQAKVRSFGQQTTNISNLNVDRTLRLPVPLPPLPEQRRIAAILDEADALRARAVSQSARLDEVEDRAFDSLLGGSVGSSVTLGDVTEELRYGTSVKSGPTGLPVLRIPNVTGRSVDASDLKTVELSIAEIDRLRLSDRDVLFVRSNGNPDVVGRCSAFSSLEASVRGSSDWVYASYLIRARLKPGVDPRAIAALARSGVGRRHLRAGAATSAGQYNINTAVLHSLPTFDPAHPAQTMFASISRKIDAQRVRARHVIDELNALFASLQHRAFRGEL